jgi:hypothetical protein
VGESEKSQYPIAKLGNIPLVTEQKLAVCGAAFRLISPAKADLILPLESSEIEIKQGQQDVVVRFQGAIDATEAFQKGHILIQQGLDLASILGEIDTIIQDAEDEHVLWWNDPMGLVVRLVSTATMQMSIQGTPQGTYATGNILTPEPVRPRHHFGFRYYRLAQSTDDLYDAYRNMYLAFEALLSNRYPILKKGQSNLKKKEAEKDWLERGLNAASADLLLTNIVPNAPDAVKAIMDIIYYDARLPLFHAKKGEKVYTPLNSPSDRKVISEALKILTQIVLQMAAKWFDVRRGSSMVNLSWFLNRASKLLEECTMLATDDVSPIDISENDLEHPRFKRALNLSTRLAPELQRASEPAVFGHINNAELHTLTALRRVDLITATSPLFMQKLESELTLSGIARLEVLMHVRAMNANQPKSLFRQ